MSSIILGATGAGIPAPDHAGSATVAGAAKQLLGILLEEPMVRSCRLRLIFGLALAVLLGTVSSSEAAFKIRISDGTNTVVVTDNGVGDAVPVSGSINYTDVGSFAGFVVTVATGTSQPLPPNSAFLAYEDIAITVVYAGGGSGRLTVDLTDTSFNLSGLPGPSNMKSTASNNSSANLSMTFQSYLNYGAGGNNEFGGIDATGGTVFTTGLQGPIGPLGNNTASANPFPVLANPFSMSSRTVLTFGAPGIFSSDNNTTVVTPAPAGLLLALSASPAFGLGYWFRRRHARAVRVA